MLADEALIPSPSSHVQGAEWYRLTANRDGLTLQVSNIAGDGRHVVTPRELPRHAEVYAPPDNWRGVKARKDSKEPGYSRDTVQGGGLQEGGGTTRHPKSPAPPETEDTWLRHVASQTGTPRRRATGRRSNATKPLELSSRDGAFQQASRGRNGQRSARTTSSTISHVGCHDRKRR